MFLPFITLCYALVFDVPGERADNGARPTCAARRRATTTAAADERCFEDNSSRLTRNSAGHGATLGADDFYNRVKDILESGQLRHGFHVGCIQHLVRRALG